MENSKKLTIDDVREYWNKRPCNISHSLRTEYDSLYFLEVSNKKYYVEPHIKSFADFNSYNGKKVLEIGCGIGTAMQSFCESGAIYFGIDLSDKSIDIAQKRIKAMKLESAIVQVANAEKLEQELHEREFDLIYSFGVLHHTPNPDNAFKELKKFAKNGTIVKIMLYHRWSTKAIALWLKFGYKKSFSIDKAVALQSEAQFGSPYTFTYSRKDAIRIAELAGFKLTNVKVDHIFPYKVKPYKLNLYKKRFYWKIIPNRLFKKIEKRFGWHLLIEGVYKNI